MLNKEVIKAALIRKNTSILKHWLDQLIIEATTLLGDGSELYKKLQCATEEAIAVYNNPDATAEQLEDEIKKLKKAINDYLDRK